MHTKRTKTAAGETVRLEWRLPFPFGICRLRNRFEINSIQVNNAKAVAFIIQRFVAILYAHIGSTSIFHPGASAPFAD